MQRVVCSARHGAELCYASPHAPYCLVVIYGARELRGPRKSASPLLRFSHKPQGRVDGLACLLLGHLSRGGGCSRASRVEKRVRTDSVNGHFLRTLQQRDLAATANSCVQASCLIRLPA